ncbi:MAG: DUF1178 family protein [Burkholderiales bacterium]|jgi:hypothetical protein
MIVYDLVCTQQHRFEGWFASTEDYARQHDQTMIRCPVCDDAAIERRPSANVQVGRAALPAAEREPAVIAAGEAEALKLMRRLVANAENVGSAFPEEARKIHYDESPKRGIRGQASPEEAEALRDEGIDFMSLPGFLTRDLN